MSTNIRDVQRLDALEKRQRATDARLGALEYGLLEFRDGSAPGKSVPDDKVQEDAKPVARKHPEHVPQGLTGESVGDAVPTVNLGKGWFVEHVHFGKYKVVRPDGVSIFAKPAMNGEKPVPFETKADAQAAMDVLIS
jgi:hypothetical protein